MEKETYLTGTLEIRQGENIITLRRAGREDMPAISDAIYQEYGTTYYKDFVYDADKLYAYLSSEGRFSAVAELNGELAGHMGTWEEKLFPGIWEMGMGIVFRQFRGHNILAYLGKYLLAYNIDVSKARGLMGHNVLTHSISQKQSEQGGMVVNGFTLNFVPSDILISTFTRHKNPETVNEKSSYCYHYANLMPDTKEKTVYLADEVTDCVQYIYNTQKLKRVCTSDGFAEPADKSTLVCDINTRFGYAAIQVPEIGSDFAERCRKALTSMKEKNITTVDLSFSADSPEALFAYEEAKKAGFFFSALFPNTERGDIVVMEKISTRVAYEDLELTENAQMLLDKIRCLMPDAKK